ncbi:MAG: sigma-E processing peptidase SpoIIGA [Clostridiales bacterium]|nr:sigma-E processing peptidase SpoIIGA [Clostridiales bacterium]
MVIYADEIFIENFAGAYALLYISARLLHQRASVPRLCAASTLGAAAAAAGFIYGVNPGIFSSFAMFVAAFGIKSGFFLQNIVVFSVLKIMTGFFASVLCSALGAGIIRNGIAYFRLNPAVMVISLCIAYPLSAAAVNIFNKRLKKRLCRLKITANEKTVETTAVFDSGNLLTEPVSGKSVIVTDRSLLAPLFPGGIDRILNDPVKHGLRLIPYSTVSGAGVMPAFLPDEVSIDGRINTGVYIGISPKRLKYGALVGA